MQTIRYQVFVSSTFTDLKEERAEVIQALWEMDCIPTGMEAFVASNEDQWKVIQRVIDDSDYYVLIIGGRYGSLTNDGISYTEKEYRYAKSLELPVLAFVHANPDEIPSGRSERDEEYRKKLDAFRTEVMKEHPVRKWTTPAELGGLVSRSLSREIRISPRPGWVRNDENSPLALLEQVNSLAEENRLLKEATSSFEINEEAEKLEQGDDIIKITGTRTLTGDELWNPIDDDWSVSVTWAEIFKAIGPATIGEASEREIKTLLSRMESRQAYPSGRDELLSSDVNDDVFNEIIIQLRALGLIEQGVKKRPINDRHNYWKITTKGDKYLVSLLARRRK